MICCNRFYNNSTFIGKRILWDGYHLYVIGKISRADVQYTCSFHSHNISNKFTLFLKNKEIVERRGERRGRVYAREREKERERVTRGGSESRSASGAATGRWMGDTDLGFVLFWNCDLLTCLGFWDLFCFVMLGFRYFLSQFLIQFTFFFFFSILYSNLSSFL